MSNSTEHELPFKTAKQLITAIVLAFVVPIFTIVLLVKYVNQDQKTGAGSLAMTPEAVAERIRPVAQVELKDVNAPKILKTGEQVYTAACAACHATGAAGAPKFSDKGAWGARISQGYDTLVQHAINGIRGMPARGGNPDLDDVEIARAVAHMTNAAGANFKAPEPKAAPAPAAAADAAAPVAAPAAPAAAPAAAAPAAEPVKVAAAPNGEGLYKQACVACHGAGVAGAPKFGDKAAWAPRVSKGVDALVQSVVKGKGAMPPKGGVASATEADIKATVEYMVKAAK